MFEEHDSSFYMNSLNVKIIQTLSNEFLRRLLEQVRLYIDGFEKNKFILELFKYRVKWLEENIKSIPALKWKMPNAKLPEQYKQIEDFLKSDKQQIVINNAFDSPIEATLFIQLYADTDYSIKNGYSIKMYNNLGKSTNVTIFKTRELHESTIKHLVVHKKELEIIKKLNLNI